MNKKKLYQEAILLWGVRSQIEMLVEECSELITVIQRIKRDREANVPEELADVEIMCEQMRLIFDPSKINQIKRQKLRRLKERIEAHNDNYIKNPD